MEGAEDELDDVEKVESSMTLLDVSSNPAIIDASDSCFDMGGSSLFVVVVVVVTACWCCC